MYAIVDIAGKQFKVSKGDQINVPKLDGKAGNDIQLDNVLMVSDGGKFQVGNPLVGSASVKAKIEDFGRDKKVIIFKKKRRKGYQVTRGHRQDYTTLTIQGISVGAKASKASEVESDEAKPAKAKATTTKSAAAKLSEAKPKTTRKKTNPGEKNDGA